MAVLPDTDRRRIWRGLMRWWSARAETVAGLTKEQLYNAIAATDAWIESNQASYNTALPQPARGQLTLAQKTLLLCAVALMRVDLERLRAVLGEVD